MEVYTLCLFGLAAIFLYWITQLRYLFKWKNIPFLMPVPFFGSMKLVSLFYMSPHDIEMKFSRKYGRIYGSLSGSNLAVTISDPELVRLVAVKDSHVFVNRSKFPGSDSVSEKMIFVARDDDWKRIRNAVTPTFSSGKMKMMVYIINECAESLLKNVRSHIQAKKKIDTREVVGAFTMDVICSTAFSTRVDSYADPNNPFVVNGRKFFNKPYMNILFPFAIAFPKAMEILGKSNLAKIFDNSFFVEASHKVLEERRRIISSGKKPRVDFLNLMIEAQENFEKERRRSFSAEDSATANAGGNFTINNKISESEMIAQCVSFFSVGFDSTSSIICLALHYLAVHQEYQDTLYQEINEHLAKSGEVTYDILKDMPFLEAVVCETLRILPVASLVDREAGMDYELGDTGITIPKGALVLISIAAMHRDPEYFPSPDVFSPDRFMPENKDLIPPYAFVPFGAGPRSCIALRFAQMETKLALIHLIGNFRFSYPPYADKTLKLNKNPLLVQPDKLFLMAEERNPKKEM